LYFQEKKRTCGCLALGNRNAISLGTTFYKICFFYLYQILK
jgi:hypothetical protein